MDGLCSCFAVWLQQSVVVGARESERWMAVRRRNYFAYLITSTNSNFHFLSASSLLLHLYVHLRIRFLVKFDFALLSLEYISREIDRLIF